MGSAKNEYDAYSNGKGKNLDILKMVSDVLGFRAVPTTVMMTQPNMIWHVDGMREIGDEFMSRLKIDDCDKPFATDIEIVKVESNCIAVSYDMRKEYYESIDKPIEKVCVEYALIK